MLFCTYFCTFIIFTLYHNINKNNKGSFVITSLVIFSRCCSLPLHHQMVRLTQISCNQFMALGSAIAKIGNRKALVL